MSKPRSHDHSPFRIADAAARLAFTAAVVAFVLVPPSRPAASQTIEVEVESIRPKKLKHPTLQFLKENRDFIRARFDLLREKPLHRRAIAADIDPRYLEYRKMLAAILMDEDSVATAGNARERQDLIRSITELGLLETELDQMERMLAEQRGRLAILQSDFTGDQRTALVVVLSGYPTGSEVGEVTVTLEDGSKLTAPLAADQRTSLASGGILQVFHGFVEPREQIAEVSISGERWPGGNAGFVTLDPTRDRLTFLRLDLSTVQPAGGAASIQASTWLHDARLADGED